MQWTMPEATENLDAIVRAARQREEVAVAALYRAFNPPLMRFLRQQAPWAADDLAAETWLSVARGLEAFEGDAADFRRWLYTIARRRVVDHFRVESRKVPSTPLGDHDDRANGGDASTVALADIAAQDAIAALLRDLPASQAEVVLLRVVADLSTEDVASITGRSVGSVRVLQHRALRRLAATWDPSAAPH